MKKYYIVLLLCFYYVLLSFRGLAQTTLFTAVPSTTSPTSFTVTRATNVTSGTPTFAGFPNNTPPCSFAPSRTMSETRTVYENAMANSYNRLNFSILPSRNTHKLLISSLGFKISSNNPNVRYNVHFRLSTMPAHYSPYFDTALVPSLVSTCNSSVNSSTTERIIKFPTWMVGTNIIDSINRMEVIITFYGATTPADIRISSIKVYGCVLTAAATTDCMGKAVESGYHTGAAFPYSKYNLVYADEFDSTTFNRNEWVPREYGGFGGVMKDSNAQVSNGMLHLKYTWDTVPSSTIPGKIDTAYIGAGLQHTKNIKYGYYEFRTKLYKGLKGLHQSIWTVGTATNSSQRSAEVNSYVNTYQNQLFEHDSYNFSLQPSIWTVKGRHYDYNNSRLKGASDDNFDSCAKYRTDGPSDVGFHAISHIKDIPINSFFTCGVEVTPDSVRYYYNGKLRLSYPFGYPYNRDVMGMSMQLSALPTPVGYFSQGDIMPLPEAGAEMTVDYMRYYAPKSCLGINFLSNFTFGDPWIMDTSYIISPNGWVEPKTKDLLGNTVSYNPDASLQDSAEYVPDAPNKYNITPNRWSLLHKLTTAPYRVATRQRLDLIPNGNYEFSAYVKGSNKPGDRVVLRVKTRTAGNLADTVYEASANLGTNVADANWRKVKIPYVPVVDNYAVVEFLSDAAAGSYTYFDSALFIGVGDTLFTVSKQGCVGGSIQLTASKLIPDSTTYQWQVSTFSNNNYNAWANITNGVTAVGSTNGFGATYANVTKDTLVIGTIPTQLQKARFRCVMTTPATASTTAYVRFSSVYQLDAINSALVVTPSATTPVYLTGTLKLDVTATGGSGSYASYAWTGPTNFSDTNKVAYVPKVTAAQNGSYSVQVTDHQGCYRSNTVTVTAQAAPSNPVLVTAAAPALVTSYNSLTLGANVTGGSGNYSYFWRGPNGFTATTLNPLIDTITTLNSGKYTIMVTDLSNNFIASDTEFVSVGKRPQTLNFRNIPNLSTYSTTTTTIPLSAKASSGLPVRFESSNTHLLSFLNDTLAAVQRANPDYSYTLLNPITTSKIRIYTTQSSHFHIREFRAFGTESSDYPIDILENISDSLPNGLVNLAATATITASGQYAIGTGFWPENATDGLVNSSWVSQASNASPAEKWLQLDFGSNKTIGNIQFVNGFQNSNGTWSGLMDNNLLRVQYWDGSNWQNITDCKVNITAIQDGDDNNLPVSVVQQLCVNTSTRTVQRNTLPPSIVIPTIASVSNNSAIVGATVMDSSGVSLTTKGIIIDTFPNPTTAFNHSNTLSGTYTQTLTTLRGNTRYYMKGFASNAAGTSFTQDTSFVTLPNAPAVTFTNVSTIGFCVNFLQSQAGNQAYTTEVQMSTQADFQANLQSFLFTSAAGSRCFRNLIPNTTYYVRARSTNAVGNGAWTAVSIATLALPAAILDGMAAPTSAFSTRMLRSAYNQRVVRVRRDIDSTFADVYFDSRQTISLNSPISFSGTTPLDSTLGGWLGNNSALVSVWYDQSGNNNHAYKNTAHILRTGTVTITNGSTTLTGSGTGFSTSNTPIGGILTTATGRVIGRVATINSTTSITLATAANFSQSGVGYGLLRQPRLADRGVLDTLENGRTAIRFFQGANSGTNLQHPTFINDSGYTNMTNMRHIHLFAVVKQENTFNFAGIFNTTAVNESSNPPANRFQFQMLTNSTTRNSFFNAVSGPNTNNRIRATAFTMNGVMNARFRMSTTSGQATASIPIATSVNPSSASNFLSAGNFNADSIQLFGHTSSTTNMFEGVATELVFFGSTIASPITENQATNLFTNQSQTFGVLSVASPTVSNIQPNEVTLGATVFRSASATISSRGSVYDTLAQPRRNALGINGDYSGVFTQNRSGLIANTLYFFRGFITTGSDTTFTPDSSFVTLPLVPNVKSVSSITTNSATAQFGFSGTMGRSAYTFSIQIGSTSNFNTADTVTIQNLADSSYQFTNLLPNTTYFYRVLIKNATGNSAWSSVQSFTTLVALPTINAPTIANIGSNTVILGANVTQNGGQTLSARGTVLGLTAAPTTNSLAEGNTATGTFTHTRSGLASNTRYFFRGYATNSAGTAYTNDSSFITLPEACSIVGTNSITPISFTPRWNPASGNADYTVSIQVSTNADFSSFVYNLTGIASTRVSNLITSLSPSTTYYYRIRFVNQTGVGDWSNVQTVSTIALPTSSLDNNTNPLLAYSVRLLRSSYTGPALRVRRDSNCDSVDVYFDGNQRVSLSSPISANGGGAATGNTLGDWVGSSSAYVTIWYDQSGNGKHTTSATLGRTGTVTVAAGSTAVTGTSTLFTTATQLQPGNAIYTGGGQIVGHVAAIGSATSLTLVGGARAALNNSTLTIQRLPRLINQGFLDTLPNGIASLRILDGANGGMYSTGLITPATSLQNLKFVNVFVAQKQLANTGNKVGLLNTAAANSGAPTSKFQFNLEPSSSNTVYRGVSSASTPTSPTFGTTAQACGRLKVSVYASGANAQVASSFQALSTPTNNFLGTNNANLFDNTSVRIFGNLGINANCFDGLASEIVLYGSTSDSLTENFATTYLLDQTNYFGVLSARRPTAKLVTATTARLGATILAESNTTTVTARGTVWGTSANPTSNALSGGTSIQVFEQDRSGLTPNTLYYYRGFATNALGTIYSEDSTFTTLANAPSISAATNIGSNSFTANWGVPSGGNATFTYRLQYSSSATFSSDTTTVTNIASGTTNLVISGLAANTVYYYRVSIDNVTGNSGWSASQSVTTLCNSPIVAAATNTNTTGFTANWQAPANQGNSTFTYQLEYSTQSNFSSGVTTISNIASNTLLQSISGLVANTTYYYRVLAANTSGNSNYSSIQTITTLANTPSISAATIIGTNGFTANWSAPSGGTATFTYRLQYSTNAAFSSDTTNVTGIASGTTSTVINGLIANTVYYYRVSIDNLTGNSGWSASQSVTTLCNNPIVAAATNTNTTGFAANWQAPANQGSAIFTYQLEYSTQSNFSSGITTISNIASNTLLQSISGLTANTLYYYRVRAVNASGNSSYSAIQSAVTVSLPPTSLSVSNVSASGFRANWSAPAAQGSVAYTYTLQYATTADFSSGVQTVSNINAATFNHAVTGLSSYTAYYYRVLANNAGGDGDWSQVQSVVTNQPFVGILDNMTTPTLAYSVRLLRSGYSGPAVRIRKDIDSTLVDVYFDENQKVSLNSFVSANGGGTATTNTLGNWIGNANGFVTIWYDQSGNGRNAIQNTVFNARTGGSVSTTSGLRTANITNFATYTFTIKTATSNGNKVFLVGGTNAPNFSLVRLGQPVVGTGIPANSIVIGTSTQDSSFTLSNNVSTSAGATITTSTLYPGALIVSSRGRQIGIVDTIVNTTTLLLKTASDTTATFSNYGFASQPRLINAGVVEYLPNGMPSLRTFNGNWLGNNMSITSFTNDGGNTNLQGMQNLNLFTTIKQEGNFLNSNGLFNTANTGTGAPSGKLQVNLVPSTSLSRIASVSSSTANSANFNQGSITASRLKVNTSGGSASAQVFTGTASNPTSATGFLSSSLDASSILIFGTTGFPQTLFEGYCPEMIFYGSTNSVLNEGTAVSLLANQDSVFVNTYTTQSNSLWVSSSTWSGSAIPTATNNAQVSHNVVIDNNVSVNSLTVAPDKTIVIQSGNTLTVNGNLDNRGTITGQGTLIMSGGVLNSTGQLRNLTINKPGGTVTLGATLLLSQGQLTINAGTFALDNYDVVLQSTSIANTSHIGVMGNSAQINYNGTGRFVVERFLNSARRGYRNIGSSGIFSDSAIYHNWQEGATTNNPNPNPGYGMHITGQKGSGIDMTTGLDRTTTGNPSLWQYSLNDAFVAISNTRTKRLLPFEGYFTVVRGDRSYNLFNPNPEMLRASTILRNRGRLTTGTVRLSSRSAPQWAFSSVADGSFRLNSNVTPEGRNSNDYGYSLVANPYPAAINWSSIHQRSDSVGYSNGKLSPYYWVWNQSANGGLGAWVTVHKTGTANINGLNDQVIQPGQSFFIQNSNTTDSIVLEIRETDKLTNRTANPFKSVFGTNETIQSPDKLRFNLWKVVRNGNQLADTILNDGGVVLFASDYNKGVDVNDAAKYANTSENIGIVNSGKVLSIECRSFSQVGDSIGVRMWNLSKDSTYLLQVINENYLADSTYRVQGFLRDKYTARNYPLNNNGTLQLAFSPTVDSASFWQRFVVVYQTAEVLPVNQLLLTLQTSSNDGQQLSWNTIATMPVTQYRLESSTNGIQYVPFATLPANSRVYPIPAAKQNTYYRVVAQLATSLVYSNVVACTPAANNYVQISPTVLSAGATCKLVMQGEKGRYAIRIINAVGQAVWLGTFNHNGNTTTQLSLLEGVTLAQGHYRVQVLKEGMQTEWAPVQHLVVQ